MADDATQLGEEVKISAQLLEIYNDNIRDLLDSNNTKKEVKIVGEGSGVVGEEWKVFWRERSCIFL